MKTQILAAIGEKDLQPVASLNAALTANDRVKYAFSLLQMATAHAGHPEQPSAGLAPGKWRALLTERGAFHGQAAAPVYKGI